MTENSLIFGAVSSHVGPFSSIHSEAARFKILRNAYVDLVVTDPPYGVHYRDRLGRTIANDDDPTRILSAFTDLYRVLKPDSVCISFYGWGLVDSFFRAWRWAGFRPIGHIVWVKDYASRERFLCYRHEQAFVLAKGHPQMPARPLDDVQPWVFSGNTDHPTQKDVRILTPLIEAFTRPGQLVLDLFAGSGSTLLAAATSGRRYLGIELSRSTAISPGIASLASNAAMQRRGQRERQIVSHALMRSRLRHWTDCISGSATVTTSALPGWYAQRWITIADDRTLWTATLSPRCLMSFACPFVP